MNSLSLLISALDIHYRIVNYLLFGFNAIGEPHSQLLASIIPFKDIFASPVLKLTNYRSSSVRVLENLFRVWFQFDTMECRFDMSKVTF